MILFFNRIRFLSSLSPRPKNRKSDILPSGRINRFEWETVSRTVSDEPGYYDYVVKVTNKKINYLDYNHVYVVKDADHLISLMEAMLTP